MFKYNKKNTLEFKHKNNTPLLPSNSKGEKDKKKIKNTKERVRLKKIKDINGMQITYDVIKKNK